MMYMEKLALRLVMIAWSAIAWWGCDAPEDSDDSADTNNDTDTSFGGCDDIIDADAGLSGEWVDPDSGLIWQDPPYGKGACWDDAVEYCEAFGDGWRLPNINELRDIGPGLP
jgi:hypothetical protein